MDKLLLNSIEFIIENCYEIHISPNSHISVKYKIGYDHQQILIFYIYQNRIQISYNIEIKNEIYISIDEYKTLLNSISQKILDIKVGRVFPSKSDDEDKKECKTGVKEFIDSFIHMVPLLQKDRRYKINNLE